MYYVKCLIKLCYVMYIWLLYPPQTLFVVGILFSHCPGVCASVRACVPPCY